MIFKKEFLQKLAWGYNLPDAKVISDVVEDTGRWSIHYRMVFETGGKFYETFYSVGATENQEERAYEYDPDDIECKEVFPVEKTIIVYE